MACWPTTLQKLTEAPPLTARTCPSGLKAAMDPCADPLGMTGPAFCPVATSSNCTPPRPLEYPRATSLPPGLKASGQAPRT